MTFEIHYSKAADRVLSKLPNEVSSEKVHLVDGVGHRSTIYQRYGR